MNKANLVKENSGREVVRRISRVVELILAAAVLFGLCGCVTALSREELKNYGEDYLGPIFEEGQKNVDAIVQLFSQEEVWTTPCCFRNMDRGDIKNLPLRKVQRSECSRCNTCCKLSKSVLFANRQ